MMRADAGRSPPDGGRARAGEAASDVFEAWWAEYPRKEGRAAARKVFDAVLSRGDVSIAMLVSKARQYATAKAHIADSKYIKQPANWLKEECWLEDPQPPRRTEPKPERVPRASKANGKAAPVEPNDDVEEEYPGPEQLFPTGSCVWRRSDGRKGEVLSSRDPGGLYYSVQVRWESGGIMWTSDDQLADEDPFTPEQRAEMAKREAEEKAAAEAEIAKREEEARAEREARAKREAEDRADSERRRKELLERFPIGARVDLIVSKTDKNGEVVKVMSRGVEVRWEGGWTSIVFPGQINHGHLVLRPSEGAAP